MMVKANEAPHNPPHPRPWVIRYPERLRTWSLPRHCENTVALDQLCEIC